MDITISFFLLTAVVILALMCGFWIGRSVRWMMAETESILEKEQEPEVGEGQEYQGSRKLERWKMGKSEQQNRKSNGGEKSKYQGWAVASPVSGTVRSFSDHMGRGALLSPEQGKLYAPASGKITRLYPLGNAMLLRTDFGVELFLRVGEMQDEMHSMYYRTYVVQNEIISKGKLLLEFDLEGLQGEGVDTAVSVTVNAAENDSEVTLTSRETIKAGEELLWVRDIGAS